MRFIPARIHLVTLILAAGAVGCASNESFEPKPSLLRDLTAGQSNDTVIATPPPGQTSPGAFHGFVLGHGTGPDTMATAPRLQGVQVTVYPHLGWNGQEPNVGEPVYTVATDANGAFQTPTLQGGDYLVTFVPPASSPYRGIYVTTRVHGGSDSGTWWLVLPLKQP